MSNKKYIKEIILERNPDAVFLEENFDEAIIGSGIACGQKHVAVYNSDKCIEILMRESDAGEIEAYEQFQYTVESTIPSENKPIIFSDFSNMKLPDFPRIDKDMTLKDLL